MHPSYQEIEATLLYSFFPTTGLAELCDRLNDRLQDADTPGGQADLEDDGTVTLTTRDLQILIAPDRSPLGAENFIGAIAPEAAPATRAALIGAIATHTAHVSLTAYNLSETPASQTTTRDLVRLVHMAGAELAAILPPLALYWSPTNRLHTAEAAARHFQTDVPFELFVRFSDEVQGLRRSPGLRVDGARLWIGSDLHVQTRPFSRDDAIQAALAFLHTALSDPAVPQGRAFRHGDIAFRVSHNGSAKRIDLIPTGSFPDISGLQAEPPVETHAVLTPS